MTETETLRDRVRDSYPSIGGKFDCRMAAILWEVSMQGDFGDEDVSNPDWGEGIARYGRHILSWTSDGFVSAYRHNSVSAASAAFAEISPRFGADCETI